MDNSQETVETVSNSEKADLNKRMENVAWGLFLIMAGGFGLVPDEIVPRGTWSIGIGVIMLGLNAARYRYQIRLSGFTTFLGVIAIVSGVLEWMGMNSFEGGLFLIILGAYLIVKPWLERKQIFGKAEKD